MIALPLVKSKDVPLVFVNIPYAKDTVVHVFYVILKKEDDE
jgi:hypothetical protein